uniref:Adenylate kinase active site lid domain-containing protein n=1 Tax=Strigamia maritima TaxID=126957 RepID=T1J187_STRMM
MVDATKRPLKLSSEFAVYADKHEIFELMMHLYQSLIVNRPEDPLTYLVNLLKCKDHDIYADKHELFELMMHLYQSLIVNRPEDPLTYLRYRVPPNVAAHAISWHLTRNICSQGGWVIPGFPRNKTQAMELSVRGIFPQYVIILEQRDVRSCMRFTNKYPEFKDYFTCLNRTALISNSPNNTSMNTSSNFSSSDNNWTSYCRQRSFTSTGAPSSIEGAIIKQFPAAIIKFQRSLISFRRNLSGLISFYDKNLHKVNAELPLDTLLKSVVETLETRPRSLAPFNPRILLLGPPASGKRSLASSLAVKYDIVNLHCGELLRQRRARLALDSDFELDIANVKDEYVVAIVKDRLTKIDCVTSGWILRGFPRNPNQAILFRLNNFFPNKVYFLDVPDAECLERVLPRRIDPVTGFIHHTRDKTPKDPSVISRLVVHPRDREEVVRQRLSRYRHHEESLVACYAQSQYIDGRSPIFSVFERLESVLLRPNPRRLHIPDDIFPSTEDKLLSRVETPPLANYHTNPLDIDFADIEPEALNYLHVVYTFTRE